MTQCETCKNRCDCKERQAFERLQEMFPDSVGTCSGYEYQKPLTQEEMKELFRKGML